MLEWFTEPFAISLTQNAMWIMVILSVPASVLGVYMVLRGLAYMVGGLAHAILPGVAISLLVGSNILWGALLAAVVVTLLINLSSRQATISEDSAISIFFTGAFAIGIILISTVLVGKQTTSTDILFGQLFGVTEQDLLNTLIVSGLLVAIFLALRKELLLSSFDPNMARAIGYPVWRLDLVIYLGLALVIVTALPAVGNLLVLAFLITPAATARLLTDNLYFMMVISFIIGVLSSFLGLVLSYHFDLAGGASIVVLSSIFFLLALLLSPRYGLITRLLNRRTLHS